MKTYKDEISRGMEWLAEQEKVVFMGQGLIVGDRIYGTLNNVSKRKCLEMPIAENLIMGAAIGLSLRGFLPVVIFQRIDFMTIAADALLNHAAIMPKMSGGQIKLPMIIRTCIGAQEGKFNVGLQHKKDLTYIFEPYIKTMKLTSPDLIFPSFQSALETQEPIMIVEYKDKYKDEIKLGVGKRRGRRAAVSTGGGK